MAAQTYIEWCDSTVNPTSGCDGCELWHKIHKGPCYAGILHEMRMAKAMPGLYAPDFTTVQEIPGRMAKAAAFSDLTGKPRADKPWLDGLPRHIFVGDMGDIFSKGISDAFLVDELLGVAESDKGSHHVWMVLTKQPRRLVHFASKFGWADNLWPGTSITSQATIERARDLGKAMVNGVVPRYFLSVEPLLEHVDLFSVLDIAPPALVIVGGESGSDARPCDLTWIRSVRDQCWAAEVPCFIKQLGSNPYDSRGPGIGYCAASMLDPLHDSKGGDPDEWSEDLRVREFSELQEG